jgi:hypothetical protein
MLQACRACSGNNEEEQLMAARQQSDEYFANAYGFTSNNPWSSPYYQPSARVSGNKKNAVKIDFISCCISYKILKTSVF